AELQRDVHEPRAEAAGVPGEGQGEIAVLSGLRVRSALAILARKPHLRGVAVNPLKIDRAAAVKPSAVGGQQVAYDQTDTHGINSLDLIPHPVQPGTGRGDGVPPEMRGG